MTLFHVTAIYRSLAQRAQMSAAPALNHVRARLFPMTRAFIWRRLLHSQTEKYTVSVNGDKLFFCNKRFANNSERKGILGKCCKTPCVVRRFAGRPRPPNGIYTPYCSGSIFFFLLSYKADSCPIGTLFSTQCCGSKKRLDEDIIQERIKTQRSLSKT